MSEKHCCSNCIHRKDFLEPCDWLVSQSAIVLYCPHYKKENPYNRINYALSNLRDKKGGKKDG
jgi:hypothetical protein